MIKLPIYGIISMPNPHPLRAQLLDNSVGYSAPSGLPSCADLAIRNWVRWSFYISLEGIAKMKKECTGCKKTKPIKQFNKNRHAQDGHQFRCKSCQKAWKQSEKGKQSKRQYARSEKGREAHKRYNQSQKGRENAKRFARTAKGRINKRRITEIRRTRKTQAGGSYTTDQWYILCKFYDFCCLRCNKKLPFEKLTLDHVKPVSKGGSSDIWNIQPLCNKCNRKKGNGEIDYRKTLPDWINRDGPVWQQNQLF